MLRSIYEELKTIMAEMELDYLTPKSILKVRWVMSKVNALDAVMRDYPGLLADLKRRATGSSNPKKVREAARSILDFINQEKFLLSMHFLLDVFRTIKKGVIGVPKGNIFCSRIHK